MMEFFRIYYFFLLSNLLNNLDAFVPTFHSLNTGSFLTSKPKTNNFNRLIERNAADDERGVEIGKAIKVMTTFSNKYVKNTGTRFCSDRSIPAVVIKGLAEHKVELGKPLCPCRYYQDKEKEAKDGFWNCPCVPMRERHECHCLLFLTEDNAFAGDETSISLEEVEKIIGGNA